MELVLRNGLEMVTMKKTISMMGCPCHPLKSEEEALDFLSKVLVMAEGGYTVAINAEKILNYGKSITLKSVIDGAILKSPDGFGAVLAARWLHKERIAKINLPEAVLKLANYKGLKLFVLGATEVSNARAVEAIRRRYPQIEICGRCNGYFSDISKIKDYLRVDVPDLVLIGMGSPRQEMLAVQLRRDFPKVLFVGCGGALDLLAGKTKRAPDFMVTHGLEWLYRLIKEPRRIKRQINLPIFLIRLLGERLKLLRAGSNLYTN